MTTSAIIINALACALNVGIYAYSHNPINIGAAVFSGLVVVALALQGR